jgi:hypothetical protein
MLSQQARQQSAVQQARLQSVQLAGDKLLRRHALDIDGEDVSPFSPNGGKLVFPSATRHKSTGGAAGKSASLAEATIRVAEERTKQAREETIREQLRKEASDNQVIPSSCSSVSLLVLSDHIIFHQTAALLTLVEKGQVQQQQQFTVVMQLLQHVVQIAMPAAQQPSPPPSQPSQNNEQDN